MRRLILFALLAFSLENGHADSRFHAGVVEAGGAGEFGYNSGGGAVSRLNLQPQAKFYLASGPYIGPLFAYQRIWDDNSSQSVLIIGPDLGYTVPTKAPVVPYFGISIGYSSLLFKADGDFGASDYRNEAHGLYLPIYFGFKCAVGEAFFLNLQPTFTYADINRSQKSFALQVGFTGLLGHTH